MSAPGGLFESRVGVHQPRRGCFFFCSRERVWGEYDEMGVTAGVRAAASARGFSMWGRAIGGVRIAPRDGRRSGHINEEVR